MRNEMKIKKKCILMFDFVYFVEKKEEETGMNLIFFLLKKGKLMKDIFSEYHLKKEKKGIQN